MLFSSLEFIYAFLPITGGIFWLLVRAKFRDAHFLAIAWLVLASLFFYGWWNPQNLWLILFSIIFNYCIGLTLHSHAPTKTKRRLLLAIGIAVNLSLLGYFKYLNFFVENINQLSGSTLNVADRVLPLAISFFTFQQIGYLVDTYRQETKKYQFSEYLLFVSFFPQLIAGPIVHHATLIPQFAKRNIAKLSSRNIAIGTTIFAIGLFKKIVFADMVATHANVIFASAAAGSAPDFFSAWLGALAYTLQLYFDFSGYSDMAIGAAYLFGIQLPINFNSPYQASSIVDFWRRWHITLSNFLRDYLYIPLGGNRKGIARRNINLMVTMLLGGLWHGAGWTFVIWGGLHGFYLVVNNQWNAFKKGVSKDTSKGAAVKSWTASWIYKSSAQLVTFLAVVIGWVFFRAPDISTALTMLQSMAGGHGVMIPASLANLLGPIKAPLQSWNVTLSADSAVSFSQTWLHIFVLLAIVWLAPNTQSIVTSQIERETPTAQQQQPTDKQSLIGEHLWKVVWKPTKIHAIVCGIALFISTKYMLLAPSSEFLYFNF